MPDSYLLSSAVGTQRLATFSPNREAFGQAHYSWKIIAEQYRKGLQAIGREVGEIAAPDIYQHPIAQQIAGLQRAMTHIAVKPIEHLRPLFGRRDVAICGWEFSEFSQEAIGGDPRKNQIHMLRQMDDVWCWSGFTTRNLKKLGVRARLLPPPVSHFLDSQVESVADVPCLALNTNPPFEQPSMTLGDLAKRANSSPIFLAVLAPYDLRKNLPELIKGFLDSRAAVKGTLLIKLIVDNVVTTVSNINQILNEHFELSARSDNVIFCGAYLNGAQMSGLYAMSNFIVSASSAEGLNLPLIEAMGRGLVAISPGHTAMKDYVSDDRAVVIAAKGAPTRGAMHSLAPDLSTTHYPPGAKAIGSAFDRAAALGAKDRKLKSEAGAQFVRDAYGLDTFKRRVAEFERTCG